MGRMNGDWLVHRDPSETFTARLFTLAAIRQSARDRAWPDGIRFQHQTSLETMVYAKGQLQPVKTPPQPPVCHA